MAKENELIIKINGNAKNLIDEFDKIKKKTADLEKGLKVFTKASAVAFAAFAAGIALTTKAFADYEKALVGVGKTSNIEGKKLAKFGKEFQKLSSEIPVATNELLAIAQASAQLGITGEKNILKFTQTIARLGVATDLTGEQAATSLARLLGLTQEATESVDVLGSVLVALGNTSKATESEILKMALSVAKSSSVFGVSSGDAAALGTVLKELGQEAQLGGSVIGKSFLKIQKAIDAGGKPLQKLSDLTLIAGKDLKKTFEDDAAGVFRAFLKGLGRLEGGSSAIFKSLEAFGLKGDEVNKIIPVLAKNTELLNKAFATTAKEIENPTALIKESDLAFATLDATSKLLKNNLTSLATNIGEQLAPSVTSLLVITTDLVKSLSELDKEALLSIATFLKWGAIITAGATSIGAFLLAAVQISAWIGTLTTALGLTTLAASTFWIALTGPIGLAVVGVTALVGGFLALKNIVSNNTRPTTLEGINKATDKLIEKQKELKKQIADTSELNGGFANKGFLQKKLADIDAEIEKLGELKKAKIESGTDFGTGSLLIRPKAEKGVVPDFGIGPQEVPLAPKADAEEEARQAAKEAAEKESAEKIEREKLEAAKILEINQALLAAKLEQKAESDEEELALKEEMNELTEEQRKLFSEQELDEFKASIDTKKEAEKKIEKDKLDRQIKSRNKFTADEIKHGTNLAKLNQFFASDELKVAKDTSENLAQLSRSKNATLKGIGKAFARVNAAISTAEGAVKAYTALAGIPVVGPTLGVAAAGALLAFGAEQQANISRMATGGFVPPTSGGSRDRFPAMLEPNELVVPAAVAQNFIQAAGIPDTQGREDADNEAEDGATFALVLDERAGEMFTLEQREGRALGLIGDE